MNRISLLDGLRGYFLMFMLLNHLTFTGGLWLAHVNHAELGYVQDAQGFVFLSGMLIGLVYARRFARGEGQEATRRMLSRSFELYLYALASLLVIVALAELLPFSWVYWGDWLGNLYGDSPIHTIGAFLLLYQPSYMDILPQYIIYLIVAPALLPLVASDRWHWVVGGSVLLWLGVQTGLTMPLGIGLENAIRGFAPDFELRGFFNPLAWQLVFFGGMVLGALTATKRIDWSRVFRAERIEIVVMALGVMAFFMVWRLGFTFGLVPEPMVQAFARFDNRADFGFVYLINFAATAYVVTWLLLVGREAAHPAFRRTAEVMHKVAAFPFLTFIGKHSLQVYTYHLLVVYLMVSFDWWYGPFDQATKTIIALLLIASLAIPAWIHANLPRLGDAVRRRLELTSID